MSTAVSTAFLEPTCKDARLPEDDAAKESNLPSRGLPGPASFEDRMGHQAPAAPRGMLGALGHGELGALGRPEAVLERALDAGVERVQAVKRKSLGRGEATPRGARRTVMAEDAVQQRQPSFLVERAGAF